MQRMLWIVASVMVMGLPVGAARWQTYDIESGLVGMKVFSMVQDRSGYLWFGTLGGGICRYDGQTWEAVTVDDGLGSNDVWALGQDATGALWIGTEVGLDRFDPSLRTDAMSDQTPIQPIALPDGLSGKAVHAISRDSTGALWIGTHGGGAGRYDGQTWQGYTTAQGLPGNRVYAIYTDVSSRVWFGTNRGLGRFATGRFEAVAEFKDQVVYAVFQDASGAFWVGAETGIYRGDGRGAFKLAQRTEKSVRAIAQDEKGHLWFGTYGGGAVRFDGQTWTAATRENTGEGLPHNWVMAILKDREGHVWFGTNGGGASRYDDATFAQFAQKDGLPSDLVVAGYRDKSGVLWFGTDGGGAIRYDNEVWQTFTTADGLGNNRVRTIVQDSSGALWFGTNGGGVSRYDGRTWRTFTTADGLASNVVSSAAVDRYGHLWIGTGSFDTPGSGVSRYDGKVWQTFTTADGLASSSVYAIAQTRDGHVWFGTDRGASHLKAGSQGPFQSLQLSDRPEGNKVQVIVEDGMGRLWFGTDGGGVARYDGEKIDVFTKKNGLTSNQIRSGLWDNQGHLWFGTLGGGVMRYDGQVVQTLMQYDGLAHNSVYAILQEPDGTYWFGTLGGGIARYRPWQTSPPQIAIADVVAGRRYADAESLRVPSSVGLVAFEFGGISFKTRPDALVYRYRLKGRDEAWRWTALRRVEYQDLHEGDYIFEVQAIDRDMVYSNETATLALTVFHQPFTSSVGILDLDIKNIFASFYKTYTGDAMGIGKATVVNEAPGPVEATLSFYLPGLMDQPTEQTLLLRGKQTQVVSLGAILRPDILEIADGKPVQAEVALSYQVNEQVVSVKAFEPTHFYGRGALTWDDLGRAAAFVTPRDPRVEAFARGLYEGFQHHVRGLRVDGNIPTAMLLFEALNAHGIRYAQDASSPYATVRNNLFAVDDIQYPAQLLDSRLGDCDDCTVLFCALLENLNIPTAFVDAPGHILMMFDSGVDDRNALGFSLSPDRYILRNGRYWIPVEVTVLGEGSFMKAWELGAATCLRLLDENALRITDVREAWMDFPLALPNFDLRVPALPDAAVVERTLQGNLQAYRQMRSIYINTHYLLPLLENPGNHALRLDLARLMIEAEDYRGGILALMPLLNTEQTAEAHYLVGYAYAALKDYGPAISYMGKAVALDPGHEGYARSLDVLRRTRDRQQGR